MPPSDLSSHRNKDKKKRLRSASPSSLKLQDHDNRRTGRQQQQAGNRQSNEEIDNNDEDEGSKIIHSKTAANPHETFRTHLESPNFSNNLQLQVHPSIHAAQSPGRGTGLFCTSRIAKNSQIAFVPAKAMFSSSEATSASASASASTSTGQGQGALVRKLAMEVRTSSSSPRGKGRSGSSSELLLSAWKATWPAKKDLLASLPLFWSGEMVALLPVSVREEVGRQKREFERDAAELRRPVAAEAAAAEGQGEGSEEEEFELFSYCWAVVNSRSFHFKPAGARPAYMVLCPFLDYMNHAPSGKGVIVTQSPKGYDVTADRDYDTGEEILATYGAHSNDKLLVNYGFVNTTTAGEPSDDDIRLDHLLIPALGKRACDALENVGFLGRYALVPATKELCFRTHVAVRARLLAGNEWEHFMSSGDDLSGDHSAAVREFVVEELMKPFLQEAADRLAEVDKVEAALRSAGTLNTKEEVALVLLRQRWTQIHEGVSAFLDEG